VSTADASGGFELQLLIFGEFTIIAALKLKGVARIVYLSRFLDLPGRPED
jgi:hypothetical protein